MPDGFPQMVLLNIHMKAIQHDLDVGPADILYKRDSFPSIVDQKVFKSVDRLQFQLNLILGRIIGKLSYAFATWQRPLPVLVPHGPT